MLKMNSYNYHIKEEDPPNIKEQTITELLNIQDWKAKNIEINEDIKIKLEKIEQNSIYVLTLEKILCLLRAYCLMGSS